MRFAWAIAVVAGCGSDGPPIRREAAPEVEMLAATGQITWAATGDDLAREGGFQDCAYTRLYDATEDRSAPWLCPGCDVQLLADVAMPEADLDCYASIAGGASPRSVERLGLDGEVWLRSSYEHLAIGPQGTVSDQGDGLLALTGDPTVFPAWGGTVTLTPVGQLELTTVLGDPMHGLTPPEQSVCGWDVSDRPEYDGPWRLSVGKQVPDGLFGDACGQGLRLHELAGQYLVIDISALDCGPCQSMAVEAEDFKRAALQHLRRVELVTLLAPTLDAPLDPTPPELLELWTDEFGLTSPVVGDRGWGWEMGASEFGELSYPTWILASPNLEVIAAGQGFPGWQPILDTLLEHHE